MQKQLLLTVTAICVAIFSLSAQVTPTIYADGFTTGLIGLNFDADGNLWATQHGSGNDDGSIIIVDTAGNQTVFMTGLPSTYIQAAGEVVGSFRTYQLPDNKVLIVVGEGSHIQSEALLIVDKTDFTPGTPLTLADVEQTIKLGEFIHAQGFIQSDPFNVDWDAEGNLYIADAGANSIVKRDKNTGELRIVKTLTGIPNPLPYGPPVIDPVPTKVLAKEDGDFLVCQLTGFPFLVGAAKVFNLDTAGNLTVHAEGFSCLTDMAYDPKDDNLCVMQFGVFGPVDSTLNFILGTAAVMKIMPDGSHTPIAQGIGGLAPTFTFDANGDLYVADIVFGQILKYSFTTSVETPPVESAKVKAFPNPFSEHITIEYELAQSAQVSAEIFDLTGRRMASFDQGKQVAGKYSFNWNAIDASGAKAAPGMYIYRLTVGKQLISGAMNLTGKK